METITLKDKLRNTAYLLYILIYKDKDNLNRFMLNATQYININKLSAFYGKTKENVIIKMLVRTVIELVQLDILWFTQSSTKIQNEETVIVLLYSKLVKVFITVLENVNVDITNVVAAVTNSMIMYALRNANLTYNLDDDRKSNIDAIDNFYDCGIYNYVNDDANKLLLVVFTLFLESNAEYVETIIDEYDGFEVNITNVVKYTRLI